MLSSIVSFPDLMCTHPKEDLVTFDGFPGLTGYVNCVRLCNSHVLKRSYLIPMHSLYTIHVYSLWHGNSVGIVEAVWSHMISSILAF